MRARFFNAAVLLAQGFSTKNTRINRMGKNIRRAATGVAMGLVVSGTAAASSVSYFLDDSNVSQFASGTNYLQVTITDDPNGDINFLVTPLSPLTSIADSNFGIDKFAFNGPEGTATVLTQQNIGELDWSLNKNKNVSIYRVFDNRLSGKGKDRTTSLSFSIIDVDGDSVESYASAIENGSIFFAAHVAGFSLDCGNDESLRGQRKGSIGKDRSSSRSLARSSSPSSSGCGHGRASVTSAYFGGSKLDTTTPPSAVPLPPAAWLFAAGLFGLVGVSRRGRSR